MEELLDMFKYVLLGVNMLLFVALAVTMVTQNKAANAHSDASNGPKQALLVTAHPDDESMFFLPLVHSLTAPRPKQGQSGAEWNVHLLCLSRGNFDGLGDIRAQEMIASGTFIGIAKENIHVLEDPKLQDGMKEQWSHDHIASIVLDYIEKHKINAVFTFDDYGISGHPNHISVHHGVKQAIVEQHKRCTNNGDQKTSPVRGWALESTNIIHKYIGVLDALVLPSLTGNTEHVFVFLFRPLWNYRAMALHYSQFVWYRRLFVIFSRYTFINTFLPMHPPSTPIVAEETKKDQ
ncbi:hypothetical protein Poli38472_001675 [Pythium oligandrum]|uniref:N-acetylglucosaminylphosphatidylinositol deacetylase n=1 Tax=Pythium oligandrum TaxID=41045 RepID=A0A8K1CU02_PYTOL|nr:hypothetical protein Poli38472_001675 [Pythium oligandrum]|eukprot:TMW69519.1 hypothetical protein Poli38472_001675 [Pythium oligandrum]